jgi:hypothetical protein
VIGYYLGFACLSAGREFGYWNLSYPVWAELKAYFELLEAEYG